MIDHTHLKTSSHD